MLPIGSVKQADLKGCWNTKKKVNEMYEYTAEVDRVVDGDTLDLIVDMGFKVTTNQRIRLAHVNTPETWRVKHESEEYKKGMEAKQFVEKRLADNNNQMRLRTYKYTGRYGRYIGEILLEDSDISLNEELVQKGLAEKVD
jgi:micrococcal nuclease